MTAQSANGWALTFGLLAALSATSVLGQDVTLGISLAGPPAELVIEGVVSVGSDQPGEAGLRATLPVELALPDPPEVVVAVPRSEPIRAADTAPATTAAVAEPDPVAIAIAARLADPKLPLPPKLSPRDREALGAFYAAGSHGPLWLKDAAWNEGARSLIARLGRADEDGLDPANYPVPVLQAGSQGPTGVDLAEAELKLSAAAYLYARDARGGRLDPVRISALITPKLDLPALGLVLQRLAASSDPGEALETFHPAYAGYRALRSKLAELRANRPAGPSSRAPGGPALARQAFAVISDDTAPVARLPKVASVRLEGDIVANMERWRWLPAEVAARYIVVNVPEYRLRLIEDGRVAHEARVITGRPATPTPIFSGIMDHAIVNPSWHIPPSIMKNEILPGLAKDPEYAAKRGYEVVRRGKAVSVRQPPGERNALGNIKFMFPNDHAVYLHDTPNRSLFGAANRAFSHGCVRVENPFALGGKLLGAAWPETRLRGLVGYGERMIKLSDRLPVSLTYFTVSIDEFGELRTFDDLYGYHRRVRAALGLGA